MCRISKIDTGPQGYEQISDIIPALWPSCPCLARRQVCGKQTAGTYKLKQEACKKKR